MSFSASRRDTGGSWLVPLADLSMILFIVTGTAMGTRPASPSHEQAQDSRQSGGFAQGVATAVFIDRPGGPDFAQWLASRRPSAGEQLTLEGRFAPADRAWVAARTEQLAQQALAAGIAARVILQPASRTLVQAVIAHDAEPQMAQALLEGQVN